MAQSLELILTTDELNKVPEDIKIKLIDFIKADTQAKQELKASIERYEFELEKQGQESQKKINEAKKNSEQLQSQVLQLEKNLSECQQQLIQVQSLLSSAKEEVETLRAKSHKITLEKEELVEQLTKRRKEIEDLTNEVKRLEDALKTEEQKVYKSLTQVEDASIKDIEFQHKLRKLEQEKELLNNQLIEYEADVAIKNQEILKLKKEKSSSWLEIQSELDRVTEEKEEALRQCTELRRINEERANKINSLATQLKEARDHLASTEEQYQLELTTQSKLAMLYKDASEESTGRVNELLQSIEEMHKLLHEAREEYNILETKSQETCEQLQEEIASREQEIQRLQLELHHANQLLDKGGIERLFPVASATSKNLSSGLSLTQLYSQYLQLQEELAEVKGEKNRLAQQLEQILAEVEEKTPIINQRQEEYRAAMEALSRLQTQLAELMAEQDQLKGERDAAIRAKAHLEREVERGRQTAIDLSSQVTVLLKEVEEARGGYTTSHDIVSSSDESSGNQVISNYLVTFKNIQELQEKNQKLIALVRDLTKTQEEQEKHLEELKSSNLQAQLSKNEEELKILREERAKHAEILEAIVQQRDTYRMLASQNANISAPQKNDSLLSSPQNEEENSKKNSLPDHDTYHEELKQLQDEFDLYKKEKAENTRLLSEQLDKLRSEVSELRVQNAKLTSQVEYSEERFNLAQTNAEGFKKEASALRERNAKLSATLSQHQQTITTLRSELLTCQERLASVEVRAEGLRSERDQLKMMEARLSQERDSLQRELQLQGPKLLANIQAVQNNLERMESESHHQAKAHLEKLEKEVSLLHKKLDDEQRKYDTALKLWEGKVADLQKKLDKEIDLNRKTHDELVEAYSQVHDLMLQLQESKNKLSSQGIQSPKKATSMGDPPLGIQHQIKTLKSQLAESQSENKSLKEKLDSIQNSNSQLKNLADQLETRLKEQTQLCEEVKTSSEKAQSKLKEEKSQLDAKVKNLEAKVEELTSANKTLQESEDQRNQDSLLKIKELEQELRHLKEELARIQDIEMKARQDAQNLTSQLKEAQENYQRELLLHAEAIQEMSIYKEKMNNLEHKVEEAQSQARQAQEALKERTQVWETTAKHLKEDNEKLINRSSELENQNNILHQQLELLGTQMAAINRKDWSKLSLEENSSEKLTKSMAELHDVIRFLRREKEIASTEADALQKENTRLQSKVLHLEKKVEELTKELEEERHHSQSTLLSESKHAELLKKIEMLNLLTDSNRVLRADSEALSKRAEDLEAALSKAESQLEPLKAQVQELSAELDVKNAEKQALEVEVSHWQTRVNSLLEQTQKANPEDMKKLAKEKEELQVKYNHLREESTKRQAELSSSLVTQRKELEAEKAAHDALKAQFEALQKEMAMLKAELATVKEESAELDKKSMQIKKIARKYKSQYDTLKAEHDEQTKESSAQNANIANLEDELASLRSLLKDSEESKKTTSEEADKLKQRLEELNQVEENLKNSNAEREKLRRNMLASNKKINELTTQNDELKGKVTILEQNTEEKNALVNTLKSQYEAKVSKLEKELKLSRENIEKLEKQLEELKNIQQRQSSMPVSERNPASEPLTANIKPTTVTPTLRYTNPPIPRTTPTASIRPLAIGSSPSSRMAAVPPTPSSEDSSANVSRSTSTSSSTPTAATVVSAIDHLSSEVSSTPIPVISVYSVPSAAAGGSTSGLVSGEVGSEGTPSSSTEVVVGAATAVVSPATSSHIPSVSVSNSNTESAESPSSTSVIVVPLPQTQVVMPTLKRPREDSMPSTSSGSNEPSESSKRIRMVNEASQADLQITPAPAAIIQQPQQSLQQDDNPTVESSKTSTLLPQHSSSEAACIADQAGPIVHNSAKSEVLVEDVLNVESDDEEDDEEVEKMEPGEEIQPEESNEVEPMLADSCPVATDEETTTDKPSLEEEENEAQEGDEKLDDDGNEQQNEEEPTADDGEESSQSSSALLEPPSEIPLARPPPPSSASRLPSRQQLAPFHIPAPGGVGATSSAATSGGYEDGDDSIVPSTPTLFVPRRGDGFAEAVSSPQVPQGRFVFAGATAEAPSQSGLSQLASQGGVDDTRMDLSQYDGRSVPTTPVQVSPQMCGEASDLQSADCSPLVEEERGDDAVPSISISEAESLEEPNRLSSNAEAATQEDSSSSQPEPSEGSTMTEVSSSAPEGLSSEAKADDSSNIDESSEATKQVGAFPKTSRNRRCFTCGSGGHVQRACPHYQPFPSSTDISPWAVPPFISSPLVGHQAMMQAPPRKAIVWKEPDTSSGPSTSSQPRGPPRSRKIQVRSQQSFNRPRPWPPTPGSRRGGLY